MFCIILASWAARCCYLGSPPPLPFRNKGTGVLKPFPECSRRVCWPFYRSLGSFVVVGVAVFEGDLPRERRRSLVHSQTSPPSPTGTALKVYDRECQTRRPFNLEELIPEQRGLSVLELHPDDLLHFPVLRSLRRPQTGGDDCPSPAARTLDSSLSCIWEGGSVEQQARR